ncbi:hypothetical protein CHU98_g15 [Xylaria longipes]|nr:hypothetical protein CHU98_g15 [Xylaria longipes]
MARLGHSLTIYPTFPSAPTTRRNGLHPRYLGAAHGDLGLGNRRPAAPLHVPVGSVQRRGRELEARDRRHIGVVEAFRSRHDPNRTMRVATAAIGAAATDSALGGGNAHKEKRHVVESVLAGLVENRVINGPRR